MSDTEHNISNERFMRKSEMVRCFNEWMRRFTEDPGSFEREFQTARRHLCELADGREPSYGEVCSDYLFQLADSEGV